MRLHGSIQFHKLRFNRCLELHEPKYVFWQLCGRCGTTSQFQINLPYNISNITNIAVYHPLPMNRRLGL